MLNWGRSYRIVVGVAGSEGFELVSDNGRDMHISIDLEKSDTQSSNQGKLQVWNLSDGHKAILKEQGCVADIRVGYGDIVYPAFLGDVNAVTDSIDNSDRLTEVELVEGRTAFYVVSSISVVGKIDCNQIITQLLTEMGLGEPIITASAQKNISESFFDNGYSFVGMSKDGLTQVLDKCGCDWSLQNGIMQIYLKGETISSEGYLLSPQTGLIDIPKEVKINVNGTDQTGYEIVYLMNSAIGINDMVQVKSKELDGTYRVQKLHITGDNYDGDWLCTAQVLEVS